MKESYNDQTTYRAMQVPHESADAARAAFSSFLDELAELRKKYRIRDVHVICRVDGLTQDGEEGSMLASVHLGNSLEALGMCAFAYGEERKRQEETMMKYLKGKVSP